MLARDDQTPLKHTPLHALHVARGGKMVPFAGYNMPVQYPSGVLREHLHTRQAAGLFDVSHMGQIVLRAKSGQIEDAALALERLVPQDILGVAPGRQRYAQFTNGEGGILDDLMVANFGDHLFLVVNAACKAEDEAHLRSSRLPTARCSRCRGRKRNRYWRSCARTRPRCASWTPVRAASTASIATSPAPATPARTALRFRCRRNRPRRSPARCLKTATCCRSALARATACGSRPGFVFRSEEHT